MKKDYTNMQIKCSACGGKGIHKKGCIIRHSRLESLITIPEDIIYEEETSEIREKAIFYLPIPNTIDEGLYVNHNGLVSLLKANAHRPKAIQYIADMLE